MYTSVGQPTVLLCESGGTPTPEITWSKSGQALNEPDYFKLSDGSLYINNTRLRDEGHFVVRASNNAGTVEEVVKVVVLAPSPPERKKNLNMTIITYFSFFPSLSPADSAHPSMTVSEFVERMAVLHSANDEALEEEYHVSDLQ